MGIRDRIIRWLQLSEKPGIQKTEPLVVTGGRRIFYQPVIDAISQYFTDAPDPKSLAAILQRADDGEIGQYMRASEEMEAKDGHLQGVANTRRGALTALDWHIEPAKYDKDQEFANEAAAFCQEELENLTTFTSALEHLGTAIGPGLAVVELIWERQRLIDTENITGRRLLNDPYESQRIRIETEEEYYGIETPPGKFVVFAPHLRAGYPIAVTLSRATFWLFVMKHYARADWSAFSEIFGMPWRVAQVKNLPDNVIRDIGKMLRDMSSDGWGILPDEELCKLHLIEAAKGEGPYQPLIDWVERKQSILWLGQHGTTELPERGSYAAIQVHDNVRADLLLSDAKNEAHCVQQGILMPMARVAFSRKSFVPIPRFVREFHERPDVEGERLILDKLRYMREVGYEVPKEWIYSSLGIPLPDKARPVSPDRPEEEIEDET
jgi:phage gp29-like protein